MDVFSIRRVCRCYGLGGFNVRSVVSAKKERHKVAPRRGRRGAGPPAVGADHRVCYRTGPRGGGGRTHGLPPSGRDLRRTRGGAGRSGPCRCPEQPRAVPPAPHSSRQLDAWLDGHELSTVPSRSSIRPARVWSLAKSHRCVRSSTVTVCPPFGRRASSSWTTRAPAQGRSPHEMLLSATRVNAADRAPRPLSHPVD